MAAILYIFCAVRRLRNILATRASFLAGIALFGAAVAIADNTNRARLDRELSLVLQNEGFTGRIEESLEACLGRALNPAMVELGRLLFFDKILGLHQDTSCAACHSPAHGFGDALAIAIGVDNNDKVGPGRKGPRNQRRSPSVVNTIFYPALMWTPRFRALSGDPCDASAGFEFPPPVGVVFDESTLLAVQASAATASLEEMAGFTGVIENPGNVDPAFSQFDNGVGLPLPQPDEHGNHHFPIQAKVDQLLNDSQAYRNLFGDAFNDGQPLPPGGITLSMRRQAIAEFQASLTAANAPLDKFARGDRHAMTAAQKRGALLFFGKANCVSCHAVAGDANEMFSDFKARRIGGPQLAPKFGVGKGNVLFNGRARNEDFGFEQTEGDPALRYTFRTAPLRNLKISPRYFHNGAYQSLADAIKHHLNAEAALRHYDPALHDVPPDLYPGPYQGILEAGIDPLLREPIHLSARELSDLTEFVRDALYDKRVRDFCSLVPDRVPSGLPVADFEECR